MEDLLRGAAPIERNLKKFSTLDDETPENYDSNALPAVGASLDDLGWYLCSEGELNPSADCDGVSELADVGETARKQLNVSGMLSSIVYYPH